MSQPTPPSLLKAKLHTARMFTAATTVTAAAAVTVTLVAPTIADQTARPADTQIAALPQVSRDVNLAAVGDMIGIYGVGPVFQALRLAGLGNPKSIITSAVGLIGNQQLTDAVGALVDALEAISPVDARVPGFGPAGVYDAVNGLKYSGGVFDGLNDIIDGIDDWTWLPGGIGDELDAVKNNLQTLLNQRRAFILGTGLGGTDTAMALQQMIKDVESDSALWGDGDNGVTGVVAVLLRNPSRPGGGLLALVTPISELFGLDFSNPDAGSYTNKDESDPESLATKVLNISITDVGWKYDLVSDAPSTLNPVSWANSVAGVIMPTYLIPDNNPTAQLSALNSVLGIGTGGSIINPNGLIAGLVNAGLVTVDPTGGQGLGLLTQGTVLGGFTDELEDLVNGVLGPIGDQLGIDIKLPIEGVSTYVTYDSGNLPLLEPFHVLPRLLSYTGLANISTPLSNSFGSVLTQMVDIGYQDVNVSAPTADGVVTFTRGMDMGGVQADQIFKLPTNLNWSQNFEIPQTIFDSTITGLQKNLLNPQDQQLNLFGLDIGDALYRNQVTLAVAGAVSSGLEAVRGPVNQLFNAGQSALAPVASALDSATASINGVIMQARGVVGGKIDLSPYVWSANRTINDLTSGLDNGGIPGLFSNATGGSSSGLLSNLSTTGTTGTNNLLGGGTTNLLGGNANRGVQPQSIVAASAETDQIGSGTPTTKLTGKDFLSNLGTGNNARAIAQALKGGSGSGTTSGLQRQLTKSQNSLTGAQERTKAVTDKLGQGDLKGAVQEVGKNIENRAKRAEQDVNNGLAKVGIKPNKKGSDDSPSKVAPKKETKTEHKTDHAA
ncbi:MAG: hypothetical protein WAV90_15420 [Gordonia amarae]